MDLGEAVIAVGVGFRRSCTAEALVDLVRRAVAAAGRPATVLATVAEKDRPVLREAAAVLGLPVRIVAKTAMRAAEDRITVRSERAQAFLGIPSVAEAAALACAGASARLLVARLSSGDATCAVATADDP